MINRPLLIGTAGAAAVFGGVSAHRQFRQDRNESAGDRLNRSLMSGFRAAATTAAVAGIGYGLYQSRASLPVTSMRRFAAGQYKSTLAQAARDKGLLTAAGMGETRAAIEAYGRNPRLMIGGGAGAGLLIGTMSGHPILGMGIGAGVGAAAKLGLGAASTWKQAGKYPGLRTAGVLAAASLLFMGTQALAPQYQGEANISDVNGNSEVDFAPQPQTLKDRVRSLRADGRLVLGLNNRRHG